MDTLQNQTPTATKRIRSMAQACNVSAELVHALCDVSYDFDPGPTGEAKGWIPRDAAAEARLRDAATLIGWSPDATLTRQAAIDGVLSAHGKLDAAALWRDLEEAGATRNAALLSRFATWHSLRGLDRKLLDELEWPDTDLDFRGIASALFLKIFRAGSVDRGSLAYVYADLAIPLGEARGSPPPRAWIRPLLQAIDALRPGSTLAQLIRCTTGLIKGDKHFKQTILEALCYAGALRVRGLDVETFFIPQRRDETTAHFNSNEWAFPLRFWSENGGAVDLGVLADT